MTLKIDRLLSGNTVVLRLIGNLGVDDIARVEAQLSGTGRVVLDIAELTLVGREGIRFLNACQGGGVVVARASAYVSDWMRLERE